jgi:hypothetical protein
MIIFQRRKLGDVVTWGQHLSMPLHCLNFYIRWDFVCHRRHELWLIVVFFSLSQILTLPLSNLVIPHCWHHGGCNQRGVHCLAVLLEEFALGRWRLQSNVAVPSAKLNWHLCYTKINNKRRGRVRGGWLGGRNVRGAAATNDKQQDDEKNRRWRRDNNDRQQRGEPSKKRMMDNTYLTKRRPDFI